MSARSRRNSPALRLLHSKPFHGHANSVQMRQPRPLLDFESGALHCPPFTLMTMVANFAGRQGYEFTVAELRAVVGLKA